MYTDFVKDQLFDYTYWRISIGNKKKKKIDYFPVLPYFAGKTNCRLLTIIIITIHAINIQTI